MIISVIHGSVVYYFGSLILFLLPSVRMLTSGMIYIYIYMRLLLGCLKFLSVPCSLALSFHSISFIYGKVFCPSSSLLTSHFMGNLLHLYLPPLDVRRGSKSFGGLDNILFIDFTFLLRELSPLVFLIWSDENVFISPCSTIRGRYYPSLHICWGVMIL